MAIGNIFRSGWKALTGAGKKASKSAKPKKSVGQTIKDNKGKVALGTGAVVGAGAVGAAQLGGGDNNNPQTFPNGLTQEEVDEITDDFITDTFNRLEIKRNIIRQQGFGNFQTILRAFKYSNDAAIADFQQRLRELDRSEAQAILAGNRNLEDIKAAINRNKQDYQRSKKDIDTDYNRALRDYGEALKSGKREAEQIYDRQVRSLDASLSERGASLRQSAAANLEQVYANQANRNTTQEAQLNRLGLADSSLARNEGVNQRPSTASRITDQLQQGLQGVDRAHQRGLSEAGISRKEQLRRLQEANQRNLRGLGEQRQDALGDLQQGYQRNQENLTLQQARTREDIANSRKDFSQARSYEQILYEQGKLDRESQQVNQLRQNLIQPRASELDAVDRAIEDIRAAGSQLSSAELNERLSGLEATRKRLTDKLQSHDYSELYAPVVVKDYDKRSPAANRRFTESQTSPAVKPNQDLRR